MEKDNPARRLLVILKKAKTLGKINNTKDMWIELLEIQKNNEPLLFDKLSKIMTLPNIILEDVKKYHPTHLAICNKSISKINSALYSQNLSGQWATFIQHINDETINYMELIASLLDYEYKNDMLNADKLNELRTSIDELIKEVISLNLNEEFKRHLLKNLKKIIDSIDDYNIMGIVSLNDALESTVGHVVINKEEFKENINESNLTEKVVTVINRLNTIVKAGNDYIQLGTNISKLIS